MTWISIKEDLPKENQEVWVICEEVGTSHRHHTCAERRYEGDSGIWEWHIIPDEGELSYELPEAFRISHWMEIPPFPKKEA